MQIIEQPDQSSKALQEACESLLFKASLLIKNPYSSAKFFTKITDLQSHMKELDILQFECSPSFFMDSIGFYTMSSSFGKISDGSDSPRYPFESKYTLSNGERMTCVEYMVHQKEVQLSKIK